MIRFRVISLFIISLVTTGLFPVRQVYALNQLRNIELKEDNKVSLEFSEKVKENQVNVEYFKDIIQLSINMVGISPAKILPVQGKYLNKIFAYQYSPKLIRCRFFINGKAEEFKDRTKIQMKPNGISLQFTEENIFGEKEEQALLEKVIRNTSKKDIPALSGFDSLAASEKIQDNSDVLTNSTVEDARRAALNNSASGESEKDFRAAESAESESSGRFPSSFEDKVGSLTDQDSSRKATLAGAKPLPSIWSAFPKLAFVVLMFIFVAAIVQKIKIPSKSRNGKRSGFLSHLGQIGQKNRKNSDPLIEVVSTHYLDTKKSIAVVRVAGRMLILGVSNESINLIAQVPDDGGLDSDAIEEKIEEQIMSFGNGFGGNTSKDPSASLFSDMLKGENNRTKEMILAELPSHGVRSRIKSRLEGLKKL